MGCGRPASYAAVGSFHAHLQMARVESGDEASDARPSWPVLSNPICDSCGHLTTCQKRIYCGEAPLTPSPKPYRADFSRYGTSLRAFPWMWLLTDASGRAICFVIFFSWCARAVDTSCLEVVESGFVLAARASPG